MYGQEGQADTLLGQVVDGFVVLQQIGAGAASTVYQAMDRERDSQLVALKVIDATEQRLLQAGGQAGNPFEREARFSRVVKNPGIVRIFRTGRLADGRYYVAMEFVKGMTVGEELSHRKVYPWREAVDVVIKAASAVASLHSIDVVHRDLKPSNLMVRVGKDGNLRVKLIDFGIAKLAHERDDVSAGVDPAAIGTPLYMAPEQARGRGTSQRTDVYALGAILYELITGEPVVSLQRGSPEAYVAYLQSDEPLPTTPLVQLAPRDLPDEIARLVTDCLAHDPERRPRDAGALRHALAKIMESVPPERPASLLGRMAAGVRGLVGRPDSHRNRFRKR